MKIALDLRIFGGKNGGLGRYNAELLAGLVKIVSDNHYFVIVKDDQEMPIVLPENFSVIKVNCHWYSWREQWLMPFILWRLRPDLVHFTHFNVPFLYRGKFVLTIHDLIVSRFPDQRASKHGKFLYKLKHSFYRLIIRHAVLRADKIIAVSKYTAKDLISYFRLNDEQRKKISVVYEGLSFYNQTSAVKLNLHQKYFLYVGNAFPHKNLEFLIRCFAKFIRHHQDFFLYLVGRDDYFYQRLRIFSQEVMGDQQHRVIFCGFVDDAELKAYYQQASAYIFPSLYEGFGLPPLEAMQFSVPVLASKEACLPEILGPAALYFDPRHEADLLNKMRLIIGDNDLQNKLKILGKNQTSRYSWDSMAREIYNIYTS